MLRHKAQGWLVLRPTLGKPQVFSQPQRCCATETRYCLKIFPPIASSVSRRLIQSFAESVDPSSKKISISLKNKSNALFSSNPADHRTNRSQRHALLKFSFLQSQDSNASKS